MPLKFCLIIAQHNFAQEGVIEWKVATKSLFNNSLKKMKKQGNYLN